MLFNAYSSSVNIDGVPMDYVKFGRGNKTLIMLPGLGDGLRSVKGTALPMAMMYREFAKNYTVYIFSRKRQLYSGCSTREMALHQKKAMDILNIEKADVIGVSMGGMIAQYLAIDYPEKINKLAIVVSCSKPQDRMVSSVRHWIDCAKEGNYRELMDSNLKLIYSEQYYRQNKWMLPFITVFTKPRSFERFIIQAEACLQHNAYSLLNEINAPTLVLGGEKDLVLSPDESRVLAAEIPGAELYIYTTWGHGLYEEAPDFKLRLLKFLERQDV